MHDAGAAVRPGEQFEVGSEIRSYYVTLWNDIWDVELTPSEFKIYCWLLRRNGAGQRGVFESKRSIAENVGVSLRTVVAAFAVLEDRRLIRCVEAEVGRPMRYVLLDKEVWVRRVAETHAAGASPHAESAHPPTQNLHTPHAKSAHRSNYQEETTLEETTEKSQNVVNDVAQVALALPGEGELKAVGGDELVQRMFEAYNEARGELPFARLLTDVRRRRLRSVVREVGAEHAVEAVRLATLQVASDPFWVKKGYGLDVLLRPGRVVEKAEKRQADGGMSAADAAFVRRARAITESLGGTWPGSGGRGG